MKNIVRAHFGGYANVATALAVAARFFGMISFAEAASVHSRSAPAKPAASAETPTRADGSSGGGLCRASYVTHNNKLVPPDDSTSNNPPAASITTKKECSGLVIAIFSAEVNTSGAGDFIHIDVRATCIGTGGFLNPCTVGSVFFGNPGHSFFQNNVQPGTELNTIQEVFPLLKRGIWRFEVLPGGNNHAFVDWRTFFIEAFQGG